jgi:hypothetical protein
MPVDDWLTVQEAIEKLCGAIWILTNGGHAHSSRKHRAKTWCGSASVSAALSVLILAALGTCDTPPTPSKQSER